MALVSFLIRLPGIWQGPTYDELFHLLSARNYLIDGTLSINGSVPYDRVALFTYLVAGMFEVFGESLAIGRIPSVIAGTALVVVAFAWLRARGQRVAAWIAAALIGLSPDLIEASQWIRFYAFQQLFVLVGVVAAFYAIEARRSPVKVLTWSLSAAASLWLAYYTLAASLVPTMAIGGLVVLLGLDTLARSGWTSRRKWSLVLGGGVVICAVGAVVATSQFGQDALRLARYSDTWAASQRNEYRFYHWYLVEHYPLPWTTLPLLGLLALRAARLLALLCATVFGVSFVLHSVMAWKGIRYFGYALPFFLILAALGLAQLLPYVRRALDDVVQFLVGRPDGRLGNFVRVAAIAATMVFCLATNHASIATLKMLNRARHPEMYSLDRGQGAMAWGLAVERLGDLVDSSEAFVAGRDIKALYYFGRADYMLTKEILFRDGLVYPEFSVAGVNVPIVSTPASLRTIMERHASGVVLFENWQTETELMIPPDALDFIRTHMETVPLPPEWGLSAYRWSGTRPVGPPDVPQQVGTASSL